MDSAENVERGTILRATVGSTVHGLHHGGQDDRDELTLPMHEPERSSVMAIRRGERTFEETVAEIEEVERDLAAAVEGTALPPEPDRATVDAFLVDAYRRAWGW